jgi:hypothetical protein
MTPVSVLHAIWRPDWPPDHLYFRSLLAQASNLFAVSCAAGTSDCLAVGYFSGAGAGPGASGSTGIILRSVDDGSTWSPVPLP